MEKSVDSNTNYLLEQLITARKEINNLRQEINSLRYVHERDISNIKRLLRLGTNSLTSFSEESASSSEVLTAPLKNNELLTSKISNDCNSIRRPIGIMSSWSPNKKATPRQSVVSNSTSGKIILFQSIFTNPEHALKGLDEFSHMWILFHFHKNELGHVGTEVAPPGLNSIKTGIFSTRSPHRPCPIGLSLVKIIKIEDYNIYFEGVDVIDQTPVLDIKPYIPYYDNPLHLDKVLHSIRLKEESEKGNTATSSSSSMNNADGWIYNAANDTDKRLSANCNDNTCTLNRKSVIYSKSIADNHSHVHVSSPSSSSISSSIDVSKDEELALKLQAEEFENNLIFEDVSVSNESITSLEDKEVTSVTTSRVNANSISYNTGVGGSDIRNSRPLDQTDRSRIRYASDMDIINRGTTNLTFNDECPYISDKIGKREAPDGEEGFAYNKKSSSSTAVTNKLNSETRPINVRVPGWMLNPKESPFTINFSKMCLQQLQEISKDKTDEKKLLIESILKEDPRTAFIRLYHRNKYYAVLIHDLHVFCRYNDIKKEVTVIKIRLAGHTCNCGEADWQCIGHTELSPGHNLP
ncbi:PREDICTED: uncharacterized protein LOC105362978 [Ceratosolen solmsi marchali]|uniref:Uncharacterized protein LOC105362978 n=1 Tax=Ceratosolen solmsi marchali TaxID=326594 RepID=A0AAJ6YIT0_9HYME|nr:PREDICTED: uncharacterized protein LOC105362978 [Ceratosolen solmsi marchali]